MPLFLFCLYCDKFQVSGSLQWSQINFKLSEIVLLMSTHFIWYQNSQSPFSHPIISSKIFGKVHELQSASISYIIGVDLLGFTLSWVFGNGWKCLFSMQTERWFLISLTSKVLVIKLLKPFAHNSTKNAIAKIPQSTEFCCCWTFGRMTLLVS